MAAWEWMSRVDLLSFKLIKVRIMLLLVFPHIIVWGAVFWTCDCRFHGRRSTLEVLDFVAGAAIEQALRELDDAARALVLAPCLVSRGSIFFGAFCLAVRTLTFCQLMGFPLNH